jgi:hypothetical protein
VEQVEAQAHPLLMVQTVLQTQVTVDKVENLIPLIQPRAVMAAPVS